MTEKEREKEGEAKRDETEPRMSVSDRVEDSSSHLTHTGCVKCGKETWRMRRERERRRLSTNLPG